MRPRRVCFARGLTLGDQPAGSSPVAHLRRKCRVQLGANLTLRPDPAVSPGLPARSQTPAKRSRHPTVRTVAYHASVATGERPRQGDQRLELSSVGVVGAGIIGAICARFLSDAGMSVTVYDPGIGRAQATWASAGLLLEESDGGRHTWSVLVHEGDLRGRNVLDVGC
jgi:hypothetical protein